MKTSKIFVGDIKKCTKHEIHNVFNSEFSIGNQLIDSFSFGNIEQEDEMCKENAILIEVVNGGYVDLDNINSLMDCVKIRSCISRDGGFRLGHSIMPTAAFSSDTLFVDRDSLKPYMNSESKKNISIRSLKKKVAAK